VTCAGTSDLACGGRKFSGNSLRIRGERFLYHGTILHSFDIDLMSKYLFMPPRQPAYRSSRSHGDFLMNLPVSAEAIRKAMIAGWGAEGTTGEIPPVEFEPLVKKYRSREWIWQQ
jgi:lipoate-protein ligase A